MPATSSTPTITRPTIGTAAPSAQARRIRAAMPGTAGCSGTRSASARSVTGRRIRSATR